jgi:hypothetical protein
MVSVRILKSTSLAIQTIEATLANLDPYNHDFPEEPNHSIRKCDLPDQVEGRRRADDLDDYVTTDEEPDGVDS